MLRAVNDDDASFLVDFVDHPESASPRGVETFELATERLAGAMRILRDRASDRVHEPAIAKDLDGLFQRLEVLRGQQHGCWSAVLGDHEPFVFAGCAVDQFREMGPWPP